MNVDLSQFHQVFFEESFEGLDVMESGLMELDPTNIDSEIINSIFRSAHSIKGGSATFGFSAVANFTHVLETLLDEVRSGTRAINQDDIDLFLQSVDCMRDMLSCLQKGDPIDMDTTSSLQAEFEKLLALDSSASLPVSEASTPTAEHTKTRWKIRFSPAPTMLATGNEPLRMFRQLSELGQLEVKVIANSTPNFGSMDPCQCYLAWELTLTGEVSRAEVDEVFEWVLDEASLEVEEQAVAVAGTGWRIEFVPNSDMLRTGNEPSRMFRELAELGEITVHANTEKLPAFSSLHPEEAYLSWTVDLQSACDRDAISQVFEWVADEAQIKIEALTPVKAEPEEAVTAPISHVSAAPVVAEQASETTDNKRAVRNSSSGGNVESSSIRVAIDKVDNLINMVGELVITQSMLGQLGNANEFSSDQISRLREGLSQLEHNTRELQESVMRIRMLPISFAFSRFPRMVRDLSRKLDKNIELVLTGEQTELDKTVMERIGDPLVHLVRNSVDHGIETPAERRAARKPEQGTINLNAYHQSGNVVIEIVDDGKGLPRDKLIAKALKLGLISESDAANYSDAQAYDLIFHPGFSTAEKISDVSGRGVGMDVVKRNIQELNGSVDVQSQPSKGTKITIRLPLTLAILDGQLVRVGSNIYIFPLVSIVESMQVDDEQLNCVAGGCDVFQLRDEYVPVVFLHEVFAVKPDSYQLKDSLLVVVESEGEKVGIVVDELAAQQQVVIKSLEQNYQRVEGVSGATILGDGTVSLILDVPGIVKIAGAHYQQEALGKQVMGFNSQAQRAANVH